MAVNCSKCGSPMSESAEFCPACGAPTYNTASSKPIAVRDAHHREHQKTQEYWLNVKCDNCSHTDRIAIPLGTQCKGLFRPTILRRAERLRA